MQIPDLRQSILHAEILHISAVDAGQQWLSQLDRSPRPERLGLSRIADAQTQLVAVATTEARAAGCEWLHVDFDDRLRPFYFDVCGFTPTNAGLIEL